eukprot:scaffold327319_cov89-Cyclotella_meneghiniana.AAC.1
MEGKAKSTKRLSNEAENPSGFSTTKVRAGGWHVIDVSGCTKTLYHAVKVLYGESDNRIFIS